MMICSREIYPGKNFKAVAFCFRTVVCPGPLQSDCSLGVFFHVKVSLRFSNEHFLTGSGPTASQTPRSRSQGSQRSSKPWKPRQTAPSMRHFITFTRRSSWWKPLLATNPVAPKQCWLGLDLSSRMLGFMQSSRFSLERRVGGGVTPMFRDQNDAEAPPNWLPK